MSLQTDLTDLRERVSEYLGFSTTWANLTSDEQTVVGRMITSGLRNFYSIAPSGRPWSFLFPKTTIGLTADDFEYTLPSDFVAFATNIYLKKGNHSYRVDLVPEHDVRRKRQMNATESGTVQWACIRPSTSDGSAAQQWELELFPSPDSDDDELELVYESSGQDLTGDNPYPLGGLRHSETIIAACLAAAEKYRGDMSGAHDQEYQRLLALSIERDKHSLLPDRVGRLHDPVAASYGTYGTYGGYGQHPGIYWLPDGKVDYTP